MFTFKLGNEGLNSVYKVHISRFKRYEAKNHIILSRKKHVDWHKRSLQIFYVHLCTIICIYSISRHRKLNHNSFFSSVHYFFYIAFNGTKHVLEIYSILSKRGLWPSHGVFVNLRREVKQGQCYKTLQT